ncbi:hypothetical protein VIGAN_10192900 [Vigna angularis var. angularis]|uniref:BHLH domain-containing protein n=1 Tax=Vigna angularis var. angularis TaxID=157739 RepID=A0A0S3T587_PHAAN|nr:transcription factor bHLH18 [Vigna angularis]BAU00343.1 hypothetical protein VIGAN_10192900 [Vigna angularis var. angularis]
MDSSEPSWFLDFETEDCTMFRQCLEDDHELLSLEIASALENLPLPQHQQPLFSESHMLYSETTNFNSSINQPKTNLCSWNSTPISTKHFSPKLSSSSSSSSSPPSQIMFLNNSNSLSVENTQFQGIVSAALSPPQQNKGVSVSIPENGTRSSKNLKDKGIRKTSGHGRNHIIAERKRRQKVSQGLIALAALIPGLKKMDKASVLGDAVRYVKDLQERLKNLEGKNKKKRDEKSEVVMVKKPRLSYHDGSASGDGDGCFRESLPRVEARVSEKDVLLRIHCEKRKGLLLKMLVEIQNLHLFVVNSSVLRFGDSNLDITIVAQMGTEYNLTINDLVKNLRMATLKST